MTASLDIPKIQGLVRKGIRKQDRMSFDSFVWIDGVEGESTDSTYAGWIEILEFGLGVRQTVSNTACSAGGATAERADFTPFIFRKRVDAASPLLALACAAGSTAMTILPGIAPLHFSEMDTDRFRGKSKPAPVTGIAAHFADHAIVHAVLHEP